MQFYCSLICSVQLVTVFICYIHSITIILSKTNYLLSFLFKKKKKKISYISRHVYISNMFIILIWQCLFSCGQPVNSFLCCNIKKKKCIKRKRKHTFAIPSTWLSTFLNTIDLFTHYTVHNILKHNYTAVLKYKRLTDSWNFMVIFVFFFFNEGHY